MTGKERCAYLKNLRKKIAEDNNIDYTPTECHYEGECRGTCPKCESEMAYLSRRVAAVGLAAVMAGSLAGCTPTSDKGVSETTVGKVVFDETTTTAEVDTTAVIEESTGGELSGACSIDEPETTVEDVEGNMTYVPAETVPEDIGVVMTEGDVLPEEVIPENTNFEPLAGVISAPAPGVNGGK